jgi:hypothetical protein
MLGLLVLFLLVLGEGVGAQERLFPILNQSTASITMVDQVTPDGHPTAADWTFGRVDMGKSFESAGDRSLVLDVNSHPHIVYGGRQLYYAWYDGSAWHYETIDPDSWGGACASLALDAAGRPHISYKGGGDLKYAYHDGTSWHSEIVDDGAWSSMYTTGLTLDGAGRPHIVYYDGSEEAAKYAYHDGATWHIKTVEGGIGDPDEFGRFSIALNGAGQPHVTYYDSESGYMKYAYFAGDSWQIESFWGGPDTSLALDSAGRPHISYYDLDNLMYAYFDGTDWQIETVYHSWQTGHESSLVLDAAGRPHISFLSDTYSCALKYAYFDGTTWITATVDSWGVGWYTSLALDDAGNPKISYYSSGSEVLKYASYDVAAWQIETVDLVQGPGGYSSLALNTANRPGISYCRLYPADSSSCNGLKYALYDGTTWHTQMVEENDDTGAFTSLALSSEGRPHISYYGAGDLKYAHFNGSSWQIEMVDGQGDTGYYTSLALDGAGRPHISYYYSTAQELRYAYYDGITWSIQTVDTGLGVTGGHTSLALDGAGRPHISYRSISKLNYAWYDGTSWHIETVDTGGVGRYSSLALDGAGRAHISYYDSYNYHLKYAWYDGAAWFIETVDSEQDVGGYTSIALDPVGRPHISYYNFSNTGLKYAWYNGFTWQNEWFDSGGYNGGHISLKLDTAGFPHISYYRSGYNYGELVYAYRPCTPVSGVIVSGSASLEPGETGTYTATAPAATMPVTLTWDNGTVGPSASYSWPDPGSYTLQVTATNGCGQAQETFTVTVLCYAPEEVQIIGPAQLPVGINGAYVASYNPPTATTPITLTWDNGATGPTAAYSWTTTGTYSLAVTATNGCGQAQDSFSVTVFCQAIEGLDVSGPLTLQVDQVGTFRASPQPITASLPLTYSWDNGATGASASYSWPATGTYTLTVSGTNVCGGVQVTSRQVDVLAEWPHSAYLPLIQRKDQ